MKTKTIEDAVAKRNKVLRSLSAGYRKQLIRNAREYCMSRPQWADEPWFWRSLSARQIVEFASAQ